MSDISKRPRISILLGSGFSVPEGVASVSDLNEKLQAIKEDEILIHSDLTAMFLDGQKDPNSHLSIDKRLFVQDFIEFYNKTVLKEDEIFHYEVFYDYYSGYLTKEDNKEDIESFCEAFKEKHKDRLLFSFTPYNRVDDFNTTFNQLLASLLHKEKYFKQTSLTSYEQYDSFIHFLKIVLKTSDIKFHTLNHDIFFDWLASSHVDLQNYYSDGYTDDNSRYYGKVKTLVQNPATGKFDYRHNEVRLEVFANKYDTPLSYFKLHGSILNTILYPLGSENKVRIKRKYALTSFHEQIENPVGTEKTTKTILDDMSPDFLSGTTNKTRYYTRDPYYVKLLNHFERNLKTSEMLYVIGYGFQDSGINNFLEHNFLYRGKKMIVIDPCKPNTDIIDNYNAYFIKKSITDVSSEELLSHYDKYINY